MSMCLLKLNYAFALFSVMYLMLTGKMKRRVTQLLAIRSLKRLHLHFIPSQTDLDPQHLCRRRSDRISTLLPLILGLGVICPATPCHSLRETSHQPVQTIQSLSHCLDHRVTRNRDHQRWVRFQETGQNHLLRRRQRRDWVMY